jgi:hypothetical protein
LINKRVMSSKIFSPQFWDVYSDRFINDADRKQLYGIVIQTLNEKLVGDVSLDAIFESINLFWSYLRGFVGDNERFFASWAPKIVPPKIMDYWVLMVQYFFWSKVMYFLHLKPEMKDLRNPTEFENFHLFKPEIRLNPVYRWSISSLKLKGQYCCQTERSWSDKGKTIAPHPGRT